MKSFTPICICGSLSDRFWRKVRKTAECWLWSGTKTRKGYGKVRHGGAGTPMVLATRVSWAIHHSDPGQSLVLHACDNPSCVNPKHLFLGSYSDNNKDMKQKDRHTKGERSGTAKLSEVKAIALKNDRKHGLTMSALSQKYGVSAMQAHRIVTGKRWEHLRVP